MSPSFGSGTGDLPRQASPIELAAMLMQAVCVPAEAETDAVRKLAAAIGLDPEALGEELLYLRAFAVDFAVLMGLGDSPAKDQLQSQYYEHWQRIDDETSGALEALEDRLGSYAATVGQSAQAQGGLAQEVGAAFAARCGLVDTPAAAELTHLGGRLFAALYDEVVALLTETEIVLLD